MDKNLPEKKFRAGAITATVWKNEQTGEKGDYVYFTVSIERNYKDKAGNWQKTSSFRAADLPKVALVTNKAYEYLVLKEQGEDIEVEVI